MVTNNANNEKTAASGKILQGQGVGTTSDFSTATYPSTAGTSGKILVSDGTNIVSSTPTFPNASATSRKMIVSDGTNWVASTETWAVPGTSGNVLTSNGTNWTSAAPASSFSPNSVVNIADDFITCTNGTAVLNSQLGWNTTSATPFTTALTAAASSTNPGIITSSAASGSCAIYGSPTNALPMILGAGAISVNWVIKVAILSTTSPRYTLYVGLGDTFSGGDMANGVYFKYLDTLNSGNWVGNTAAASSRTTASSAVAVINSAFVNLGITVNAAATSASFLVNGVEIANSPIVATIPTAAVVPTVRITGSVGTPTVNSILIDLFYMTQTLTTPR